ncbi:MAG: TonB family protein [Candidatus Krumholzibacteriales bacterium]
MNNSNQHKISRHRREPKGWIFIISIAVLAHLTFFLLFKTEYLKVFEWKGIGQGSGDSSPSTSYIRTGEGFKVINTGENLRKEARKREQETEQAEEPDQPAELEYGEPPPGVPSLEGLIQGDSGAGSVSSGTEAVTRPKPLFIPWPSYPEEIEKKYQGQVKLELLVNVEGDVDQVRILEGLPSELLNRKAVESARNIRFIPGKKNGKNSPMWVRISIGFRQK